MAEFQVERTVTFAVEAETQEDAEAQAAQWHGLAAVGQYHALTAMASVTVRPPPSESPERISMSNGI